MKHTADRDIGLRAAKLIRERAVHVKEQMYRLGLRRNSIHDWESGACAPSVYALQAMAYQGYDVVYVLTGQKGRNREECSTTDK